MALDQRSKEDREKDFFEAVTRAVMELKAIEDIWEKLNTRQQYQTDDARAVAVYLWYLGTDIVSDVNQVPYKVWLTDRTQWHTHTECASVTIGTLTARLWNSDFCPNAWQITLEHGDCMLVSGVYYGMPYKGAWIDFCRWLSIGAL